MSRRFAIKIGAFALCMMAGSAQVPAFSHSSRQIANSVKVAAKKEFVYKAIQKARNTSGCRKLVSYKNNQAVVEELFDGLPLIGTAKCTYQENETSPTRIDYSMIASDKLARFEGAWILTSDQDGNTIITLTSTTECRLRLPFADKLTTQSAAKRIERRLSEISAAALAEQRLALEQEKFLVARR